MLNINQLLCILTLCDSTHTLINHIITFWIASSTGSYSFDTSTEMHSTFYNYYTNTNILTNIVSTYRTTHLILQSLTTSMHQHVYKKWNKIPISVKSCIIYLLGYILDKLLNNLFGFCKLGLSYTWTSYLFSDIYDIAVFCWNMTAQQVQCKRHN